MPFKNRIIKVLLSAMLLFTVIPNLFAQRVRPGNVTDKQELRKLMLAVEANPDSLSVHKVFIEGVGIDSLSLVEQYDVWMKKYPKSVAVPFALANAYIEIESPKSKPYLLEAIKRDSTYARAWAGLWMDAERWGDAKNGQIYLEKATLSDPTSADYAFSYASSFEKTDPERWTELSLQVVKKFPNAEEAPMALFWLAYDSPKLEDKIKYYELLKTIYNPAKVDWSSSGMREYFFVLLSNSPEKAVALAMEMEQISDQARSWKVLTEFAKQLSAAKKLLDENKAQQALLIYNKLVLPEDNSFSRWSKQFYLIKANAIAKTADLSGAYALILATIFKTPTKDLINAAYKYGTELKKNAEEVKSDIKRGMAANAKAATPFTLKKYIGNGTGSLSDYRGRVVLLTYWFPGCGPCRAEFPYFENVVKSFSQNELAYIGINISPRQNDYVVPFMKQSGNSFTPLEDFNGREKGNLDNRNAAPVNFLIDKEGRIAFSKFRIDKNNEDELKLMIDLLL